jgi:hypothetical protein
MQPPPSAALSASDCAAFGASADALQQLRQMHTPVGRTRRRVVQFGRGFQQEDQIKQFVHKHTLLKFALMCRKLNIDPLHAHSVHIILLLFGKVRQKRELVEAYCAQHDIDDIIIDWDAIHDGSGAYELSATLEREAETLTAYGEQLEVDKLFYATSDWQTIINYLKPQINEDDPKDASHDRNVQRMQAALVKAGLNEQLPVTTALTLRALLFIMPGTLAASKMLERLFAQPLETPDTHGTIPKATPPTLRDLEFRCLRALADYNDTAVDESAVTETTLLVMSQLHRAPIFDTDMRTVLQTEDAALTGPPPASSARVRLRDAVRTASTHNNATQGFQHWLAQQRFVITMSKHLQLLLYFIHVQVDPVPAHTYSRHLTADVLARVSPVPIQQIDVDAVLRVIRSMRVCTAAIPELITFRSTCLLGINSTRRMTITLPQVLQLYVAAFQHETIRQRCWCGVVDIWNHTIADATKRFREQHTFQVAHVIDTVVKCQLAQDTEAH